MAIVLNGTTGITNDGGYTGDGVVFADTTPANTLVTTTGGNVGIGTSSPEVKLNVSSVADIFRLRTSTARGGGNGYMSFSDPTGRKAYFGYGGGDDAFYLFNEMNTPILFGTNNTERARIDSGGNWLVAQSATTAPGFGNTTAGMAFRNNGQTFLSTAGDVTLFVNRGNDGGLVYWQRGGANVGSIAVTSTTTSYATSSDYRLKEQVQPMTGGLETVLALKPCTYTWKVDGSAGQGFIAHELQAVVPDCVTGEKDAVDAEGNPRYQGIDTSFLVATLTAAIQEQQAIITALTARVEALEGTQA